MSVEQMNVVWMVIGLLSIRGCTGHFVFYHILFTFDKLNECSNLNMILEG